MIAYDLQCTNGHAFEGWFEDRKAYLDQQDKGMVSCPVCNDKTISIIPSTFAIKSSQVPKPGKTPLQDDRIKKMGKEIVDFVEKNFDDVGCDFAKEALKIHYGVTEPRNIRGVSTKAEEKTLKKEGIQFFKIPMPAPPDSDSSADS
jgi:hypothetical protein